MNALFLALLPLFAVVSAEQGVHWSRDVSMQINREGAQQSAACSPEALTALETEVGEWLRDEFIDLFGESAFTIGEVTGVEDGNTFSLVASVECLECSKVTDKKSIAHILMFFMQHMMDEWIEENDTGVLAGCMGEDTTVHSVSVGGKKVFASVM